MNEIAILEQLIRAASGVSGVTVNYLLCSPSLLTGANASVALLARLDLTVILIEHEVQFQEELSQRFPVSFDLYLPHELEDTWGVEIEYLWHVNLQVLYRARERRFQNRRSQLCGFARLSDRLRSNIGTVNFDRYLAEPGWLM